MFFARRCLGKPIWNAGLETKIVAGAVGRTFCCIATMGTVAGVLRSRGGSADDILKYLFSIRFFLSSSEWVGTRRSGRCLAPAVAWFWAACLLPMYRLSWFVCPCPCPCPPPAASCVIEGDCNSKGAARWGWRDGKMSQVNKRKMENDCDCDGLGLGERREIPGIY